MTYWIALLDRLPSGRTYSESNVLGRRGLNVVFDSTNSFQAQIQSPSICKQARYIQDRASHTLDTAALDHIGFYHA